MGQLGFYDQDAMFQIRILSQQTCTTSSGSSPFACTLSQETSPSHLKEGSIAS